MNSISREKLEKGISGYRHEQDILLRLLRKRGCFDANEFDKWFMGREYRRPRFHRRAITGDSFILGMGGNGGTMWAEMLELLQIMVALGEVDTGTVNGCVVYKPANKCT